MVYRSKNDEVNEPPQKEIIKDDPRLGGCTVLGQAGGPIRFGSAKESAERVNSKYVSPEKIEDFFAGCEVPVLLVAVRRILDMVAEAQDHKPFSLVLGTWFVANAKQLRVEEPGESKKNSAIIATGTPVLRGPTKESNMTEEIKDKVEEIHEDVKETIDDVKETIDDVKDRAEETYREIEAETDRLKEEAASFFSRNKVYVIGGVVVAVLGIALLAAYL